MYTLLIVEDENKTRAALKDFVPWKDWEIGVIFEAANGLQALELARDVEPDFVVTDIRMPVMDGLELARHLQEEFPDTGVIMLSAYSDLSYMKSAMKTRAIDYLLKPVDLMELGQAVCTAIDRKKEAGNRKKDRNLLDQNLPILREQFFLDLLENKFKHQSQAFEVCETLGLDLSSCTDWTLTVFKLSAKKESQSNRLSSAVRQEMKSVLRHAFRQFDRCFVIANSDQEWFILLGQAAATCQNVDKMVAVTGARKLIEEHFELSVTALIANKTYSLIHLHLSMAELVSLDGHQGKDPNGYQPGNDRDATLVQSMKTYIHDHYPDETLTVNDIAEHLNYTSAYVCMVYKKATGMTLNHYINLYRIRVAKELLEDPALKMFDVATRVGYSNENYFSKVFKKYENTSPSDFRRGIKLP